MKGIFILGVIFSFFMYSTKGSFESDKVIVAINCGSSTKYSSEDNDIIYDKDNGFDTGIVSNTGQIYRNDWAEFQDIEVYHTERYAKSVGFSYKLPLPRSNMDGHYVLVLKFSEVYFTNPGKKLFDVALGSQKVITNLDIFAEVGIFEPLDKYVEFDIKNGKVVYSNSQIGDAINQNKDLIVNFLKGKADNPKVNGIVLVKGTLDDTNYKEYQNYFVNKEKLAKQKEAKQSEKRKKDIEGMIEADEDLDLSKLGQVWSTGITQKVNVDYPLKKRLNSFLLIPNALEIVAFAFVAIFFIIFSMVIFMYIQ